MLGSGPCVILVANARSMEWRALDLVTDIHEYGPEDSEAANIHETLNVDVTQISTIHSYLEPGHVRLTEKG